MMRVGGAGGPERYEGFCVDMLRELAALLKFRFHIKLVEDGLYGAPEPNGSWTGMVGELINRVRAAGPGGRSRWEWQIWGNPTGKILSGVSRLGKSRWENPAGKISLRRSR